MMNNDSWDNSLKTYNNNCEPTIRKDIARMRIMISDGHYSDEKQFNGQFIFPTPSLKVRWTDIKIWTDATVRLISKLRISLYRWIPNSKFHRSLHRKSSIVIIKVNPRAFFRLFAVEDFPWGSPSWRDERDFGTESNSYQYPRWHREGHHSGFPSPRL